MYRDHVCDSEKNRFSANPPAVAADNKERDGIYTMQAREAIRASYIYTHT